MIKIHVSSAHIILLLKLHEPLEFKLHLYAVDYVVDYEVELCHLISPLDFLGLYTYGTCTRSFLVLSLSFSLDNYVGC